MKKSENLRNSREFYTDQNTVKLYDVQRFESERGRMRYRLQWKLLVEMLPTPPATLLEIGCGTGIFTKEMNQRGYRIIAIDPSSAMLNACQDRQNRSSQGIYLIGGDGMMIPVKKDSVDASFCLNVLSHFPEPIQIVSEMIRITRPGGSITFNFTNLSSPVGKLIHYLVNPVRRLIKSQKTYTRYHSAGRLLIQCRQLPVTIVRVTGIFPLDWRIYPKNPSPAWIERIEKWEHFLSRLNRISLFQQGWVNLQKQVHPKIRKN